ncbi:MAG: ATP-binding protein, partial [Gammaproteobacteria bacterium]|nr:ATP-binding protein [Gammaproteobacteria bacterium]
CSKIIIHCEVPTAELRKRIVEREDDPSEANLEVLEQQLQSRQPISAVEKKLARTVTVGGTGISTDQVQQVRDLLAN